VQGPFDVAARQPAVDPIEAELVEIDETAERPGADVTLASRLLARRQATWQAGAAAVKSVIVLCSLSPVLGACTTLERFAYDGFRRRPPAAPRRLLRSAGDRGRRLGGTVASRNEI